LKTEHGIVPILRLVNNNFSMYSSKCRYISGIKFGKHIVFNRKQSPYSYDNHEVQHMLWRQDVALSLVVIKSGADIIRRYINSMKQKYFLEAKSHSSSQEIHQVRRDRGVHSATGIYLEDKNPVHILPLSFFNLHFITCIILTRIFSSTEWRFSFKFSNQNFVMFILAMLSLVTTLLIFLYFYSQIVTFPNIGDKGTLLKVSDKKLWLLSSAQSKKTTPVVSKFWVWFHFPSKRVPLLRSHGKFYNW
jgi:hypothetical protein